MTMMDLREAHPTLDQMQEIAEPGWPCFFCGNPLGAVCVMWHAAGGELWLHAKCARELGVKLTVDGDNAHRAIKAEEFKRDRS
jgi:hypothetical protein